MFTSGYFHDLDISTFEQQMSLNYMGCLHAAKAVFNSMVARNTGHICFVSSTLGLLGATGSACLAGCLFINSSVMVFVLPFLHSCVELLAEELGGSSNVLEPPAL